MALFFLVGAAVALVPLVSGQPPIPDARDAGYRFSNPSSNQRAMISVEVFGDFQCPDTKELWETTLRSLITETKYDKAVSFVFHPFPLPYHRSGFSSAQAVQVVLDHWGREASNRSAGDDAELFVKAADAFFSGQGKFQTDVTVGMSDSQIFEEIFAPIAATLGMGNKSEFVATMADGHNDNRVRAAWKMGCTRGVYGTPTLALNGVVSTDAAHLLGLKSWLDSQLEPDNVPSKRIVV